MRLNSEHYIECYDTTITYTHQSTISKNICILILYYTDNFQSIWIVESVETVAVPCEAPWRLVLRWRPATRCGLYLRSTDPHPRALSNVDCSKAHHQITGRIADARPQKKAPNLGLLAPCETPLKHALIRILLPHNRLLDTIFFSLLLDLVFYFLLIVDFGRRRNQPRWRWR